MTFIASAAEMPSRQVKLVRPDGPWLPLLRLGPSW